MKNSRMSSWSLTTKFFMAMLLILIVVGGIAASNILMSRQVEETLAPLIGNDVKQIIRNAALPQLGKPPRHLHQCRFYCR